MTNQKIVTITDSSAYIPEEAQLGLDIEVIPLWLIWDDDRYRDGIDIEPQSFYTRLKDSKSLPTSSQPSAKEFELFFRHVAQECDAIVAVLASSRISGTVECAQAALADFPDFPIRIVDSLSSSMGQGFAVLAAARAAKAGKTLDEVVTAAESMRDKIQLLFIVDTLEFLHRGGRIGGAKRLFGTALNIKPILHFENGLIESLSQARTKRKAINQMLEIIDTRLGGKHMAEAAIVDVDNPEGGQAIVDIVRERFSPAEIFRAQVSPVVGTHVGPGAIGVAFYAEE
jgi:DegV family protein with EDD domain